MTDKESEMKVNIAIEYLGYLSQNMCAVGDDEIANLDMSATTMHYYSGGFCDPIEPIGQGPRYHLIEVDVPDWLITGLAVNNGGDTAAARRSAALLMAGTGKLRELAYEDGKFARSLQDFFAIHGYLTNKQYGCIGRDFRKYNR